MIRGWCPGVHTPMPSGDGLLLRIKPFGGRLTANGLRAIAEAAGFGNGAIELTGRGNIQLRGLAPASAREAAALLVAAGLADGDPTREARRNVIAVPPCDDALAAAIEAVLADIPGLAPKFCVAIGPANADIVLRKGWLLVNGRAAPCAADAIPDAVRRLAGFAAGRRLRALADTPCPGFNWQDDPLPASGPPEGLLALPFGQTDAAALHALAGLIGAGIIRTTPWRSFYLAETGDPERFASAGFITDPHDPRRHIIACAGAPSCASASVPARADAAWLAARGIRDVHVSGCAKGCAHPHAMITLVGARGRYDLVRHGRAGDHPAMTSLTITQAAAALA